MYTIKVLDTVRVIVDPQKFLVLPGSSPILYLITMESKCLKDNIKYEELELNETYQCAWENSEADRMGSNLCSVLLARPSGLRQPVKMSGFMTFVFHMTKRWISS